MTTNEEFRNTVTANKNISNLKARAYPSYKWWMTGRTKGEKIIERYFSPGGTFYHNKAHTMCHTHSFFIHKDPYSCLFYEISNVQKVMHVQVLTVKRKKLDSISSSTFRTVC